MQTLSEQFKKLIFFHDNAVQVERFLDTCLRNDVYKNCTKTFVFLDLVREIMPEDKMDTFFNGRRNLMSNIEMACMNRLLAVARNEEPYDLPVQELFNFFQKNNFVLNALMQKNPLKNYIKNSFKEFFEEQERNLDLLPLIHLSR